ncbi:ATP-grasp peptide maturase system methyltransferase [Streptomyces sp. NBC_01619]|uniref:ATP-grasp peptide maturase system methyltransferase n=1 Tax=Streptomyces sp. NBC_01619 TaxID=2975901 RepID=UPI002258572D|nr:ATP-grasp peptide maturase system methyltransferase [Streptomyces sp. NBC_01619]MCX4515915.1 ATP-grasp peptide maturase system methyltransferase [Streptomyces sp. NBC_01619]
MTNQAQLHEELLDTLAAGGSLRTDPWKKAAAAVPRHAFLRGGFFRHTTVDGFTAWESVLEGEDGWLEVCYRDESLVTQVAGTIVPTDIRGQITREPTSSSTLPSLVLRMLEDLHVEAGMRVLEIGTGTGYSTAVLSTRLGDQNVTSVEYDEGVAARARTALAQFGTHPTLVTGDGLLGHAADGPYDRIIATCGVKTVPGAWIEQTRPGGSILATIGGWLGASELARLTVHDDGTASGPLLSGQVSFMLARPHTPPPLGLLPDLSEGKEREAIIGADVLTDWTSRFVVQFAVPDVQRLTLNQDGRTEHVLIDVASGSWAALYQDDRGRWIARQHGPHPVWDAAEEQLGRWHAAGTPAVEEFTVTVNAEGQTLHW